MRQKGEKERGKKYGKYIQWLWGDLKHENQSEKKHSRPKKTAIIFFLLWHDFLGGWFNLADTICCFINKLYPTNHSDIMSQTIINVGLARKDWNE